MAANRDRENEIRNAKSIVRAFSWKAYAEDPNDDLAKPLMIAQAGEEPEQKQGATLKDQWMQHFDPAVSKALGGGKDEIILAKSTEKLAKVYKKFLKCLPKDHQARIEDGPPRLDCVTDALRIADAEWKRNREETKIGRAKTLFTKVAQSLFKYQDLFAIVPSGDKYVSLVAGSLSAIVKATINHIKIAESVSSALDDLSDDIAHWKNLLELNNYNMRMEHLVAQMYVVVFDFLATIMDKWSSKSSLGRLVRSFDSDFFKSEIETKRQSLHDLEQRLEKYDHLEMHRAVKIIEEKTTLWQDNFLREFRMVTQMGRTERTNLEQQVQDLEREVREHLLKSQTHMQPQSITGQSFLTAEGSKPPMSLYPIDQLQENALQRLRSYTAQVHIAEMVVQARLLNIGMDLFNRILQWNAASASSALWIQGPFQVPQPSQYTQLSAYVIMTAQRANIPVIYYFCDSTTSMVDLIYTLIGHLVGLLPGDFYSSLDFSEARFDTLDGRSGSIEQATTLFKDLISEGPCMLFVVIDGIQMLDTGSDRVRIRELVNVLHYAGRERNEKPTHLVKTLLTTDGSTDALIHLPDAERIDCTDSFGEEGAEPEIDAIEVGFLQELGEKSL